MENFLIVDELNIAFNSPRRQLFVPKIFYTNKCCPMRELPFFLSLTINQWLVVVLRVPHLERMLQPLQQ